MKARARVRPTCPWKCSLNYGCCFACPGSVGPALARGGWQPFRPHQWARPRHPSTGVRQLRMTIAKADFVNDSGLSDCLLWRGSSPGPPPRLAWGAVTERLVQALMVVEFEVGRRCRGAPGPHSRTVRQSRSTKMLSASAPVHTDRHPIAAQQAGKAVVGELATLVGVEDFGFPVEQPCFQPSTQKPASIMIRHSRSQNVTAQPVHDRDQVKKPVASGYR